MSDGLSRPSGDYKVQTQHAHFALRLSSPSSPTSAGSGSMTARSPPSSKKSKEFVRGPWDHSGCIQVPIDVGAMLPPPMPAAVNVRGEESVQARRWAA